MPTNMESSGLKSSKIAGSYGCSSTKIYMVLGSSKAWYLRYLKKSLVNLGGFKYGNSLK